MDDDPDKNWLSDKLSKDLIQQHRMEKVLYEGKTRYQSVKVVQLASLGACLVLDGKIQSSENDEFIYHEALVQPAMIAHPCPEKVFIAGGGEGAALRQALTHKTVKKAVMVEIDGEVTLLSRKYMPALSRGAFKDKRVELYHEDARAFLAKSKDKFDVIVIDLPDPIEEGPAYRLFTKEFYGIVLKHLTANGIISVQAGCASQTDLLNLTAVYKTLKSVFPVVNTGVVNVPTYGGPWGLCFASNKIDLSLLSPEEIDKRIAARSLKGLKFYDGLTHRGMFLLPLYLRKALAGQRRLITDNNPLYLYGK
jgi:spermidine synthase